MKTQIKYFLLGSLSTLILTSAVAIANYEINPNTFPITVNNNSVAMEGYNINGSTYFKLRDIGEQTGFKVDFVNDTITIDTGVVGGVDINQNESTPLPTPRPYTLSDDATETSDGLPINITDDGEKYISQTKIIVKYKLTSKGYMFGVGKLYKDNNIIVDNIKYCNNLSALIDLEYYETTLLPIIETL